MPSVTSPKKKVLCKCPQCGKEHFRYMWWTGEKTLAGRPYMPRKICAMCKKAEYVPMNEEQLDGLPILMDIYDMDIYDV